MRAALCLLSAPSSCGGLVSAGFLTRVPGRASSDYFPYRNPLACLLFEDLWVAISWLFLGAGEGGMPFVRAKENLRGKKIYRFHS